MASKKAHTLKGNNCAMCLLLFVTSNERASFGKVRVRVSCSAVPHLVCVILNDNICEPELDMLAC